MKTKGILFDMDGVIVDNLPYHVDAWMVFCERHGFNLSRELFFNEMNGLNAKSSFEYLFKKSLTKEEVRIFEDEKEEIYREYYKDHIQAAEGLLDFIDLAKKEGIKIALATSAGQGNIDFTIDGLGIRDKFDAIIGGHQVKNGKPDPEIYIKAAEMIGLDPKDCVVIEDSIQGMDAGYAAGARVIGITTTHRPEELTKTFFQSKNFLNLFPKLNT
ncbi:MAG: hypothetical protein RIR51_214 [Bacteroidota bacterium]|jgi:beta-phosphoglucomutase family hydrolase